VLGVERRINRVYMNNKKQKKTFSQIDVKVQPPSSPEINTAVFFYVGTLKVVVYPVAVENEESLPQRVLRPVRPFATVRDL